MHHRMRQITDVPQAAVTSQLRGRCFDPRMPPSRASIKTESTAHLRRVELRAGEQVRELRRDAGVSLSALAEAVGVHRTHVARIEAGTAHPSLKVLSAIGIALGAEIGIRYFSGVRPRLHDRFQAPMIETLLSEIDDRWHAEVEVPVTTPRRGVIDVVLDDRLSTTTVSTEAYSQIGRLEEQIRWAQEKAVALAAFADSIRSDRARADRVSPAHPPVHRRHPPGRPPVQCDTPGRIPGPVRGRHRSPDHTDGAVARSGDRVDAR